MKVAILFVSILLFISAPAIGVTWGIDRPLGSDGYGKKNVKVVVAKKKQQKQSKSDIVFVNSEEIVNK